MKVRNVNSWKELALKNKAWNDLVGKVKNPQTAFHVTHTLHILTVSKVKVKVTFVQALRLCTGRTAYRESRGIALPFHDHGTRRG